MEQTKNNDGIIDKKYKTLCKEIEWRFKNTDYKEEDKSQVVIHETINKEVSFISIYEVEELSNALGVTKILEIEQSYIGEFGEFPDKVGIDKLRVLLYWFFEQRVYGDNNMRKILRI